MPRVVPFHSFWQQAFAAPLAAACKRRAAPFCLHAGAESVLTFACSLGWLVSAFHKSGNRVSAI